MSWRINNISFTNFKFFKGEFEQDFARNNILLYGENGAGKSSVFWGLYTLFQSCLKTHDEAIKYFIPHHNENLRNRFANDAEYSGLKVCFKDDNGGELAIEDSINKLSVTTPSVMQFLRRTAQSSDFINYKFLSTLFNFRNGETNDVYNHFNKDIFPFLNFRTSLVRLDYSDTGLLDAESWWKYISTVYKNLPKNKKNKNSFNQATQEYKEYMALLAKFNTELEYALTDIEIRANRKIKDEFGIDASISFSYVKSTFNDRLRSKGRSRNGKIVPPKIILEAKMIHPGVVDTSNIHHPQSFLMKQSLHVWLLL